MPQRAPAMPPEARRAAIVDATLPLLLRCGTAISTRQIAEAAGIAEGTIFRVFPDKDAVIRAAVERAFDAEPTERELAAIDRALPFDEQLAAAVEIVQRRTLEIWRLLTTVGEDSAPPPGPPADLEGLVDLLESHRTSLRIDARSAGRRLRALTIAVSHPMLIADEPMKPTEIVSLLLDGIRTTDEDSR